MQVVVFNHIEKCGGSSLRKAFFKAFSKKLKKEEMYIPTVSCPNMCIQNCDDKTVEPYKECKLFFDHSRFMEIEDRFNLEDVYRITSVRHPLERMISHYYFFDNQDSIDFEKRDIKWIRNYCKRIGNLHIRKIADKEISNSHDLEKVYQSAIKNIKKFDFVFILAQLSHCIRKFNKSNPFKVKLDDKFHLNVGKKKKQLTDKHIINIVKEEIKYDLMFYRYVVDNYL